MDNILLGLLIIGIVIIIFLQLRKKDDSKNDEKMVAMMERLAMLSEKSERLQSIVDQKLKETHESNQNQLFNVNRTIQSIGTQYTRDFSDLTKQLSKLEETNKQVVNFSEQLKNLQDILKNPKQRGVLGEYFLEETLKNVLPPGTFQMQYSFKDGTIVDAAVFVKDKIIPVDSKFSLENYEKILGSNDDAERERLEKMFKQDLKNRIDETGKYIKPDEGTLEFAFMFIPSEAIYYDLLINKIGAVQINTRSMIEYAFCEKRVIIVSPTSFLAYLQTVLQGLKAMEIEKSAKDIIVHVEKLKKHMLVFDDVFMKKLATHLGATINCYNGAYKEFNKIDKDVVKIAGGEKTIEPVLIDKPNLDD